MSGVAVAIGAAAVVGAAATVYASNQSKNATENATNAAINQQNKALSEQAQLSQPYRDLGTSNLQTYQSLLSGGPSAQQTLENLPGYKATLDTGVQSAERAAAASGLNLSGNQVTAVQQYGSQLADNTYQQQLNNLLQPIQLGQAAAAGQAANIGTSANNISNLVVGQGNTNAAINANEIAGLSKIAGTSANQYLTYNTLKGLNNPTSITPTYSGPVNFDGSANVPTYGAADAAAAQVS